jgi:hypothetical protein
LTARYRPDAADAAQSPDGAFIESAGHTKVNFYAWLRSPTSLAPEIEKMAERMRRRQRMTARPFDLTQFAKETARLREIYCGAWERNWGFVPPTDDEFRRIANEMKPIIDPTCAVCLEVDGRAVACAVALPDINQALRGTDGRLFPLGLIRLLGRKRIINQIRLLLLGVRRIPVGGPVSLLICELQKSLANSRTRAWNSPGCSKTTTRSQAGRASGRSADKTYRITRKRSRDRHGRRHRRHRVHRPALTADLIERASVRAIVRPGSRSTDPPGVLIVRAPLEERALAEAFDGVDAVVHLAGVVSAVDARTYATINAEGTRAWPPPPMSRARAWSISPALPPRGPRLHPRQAAKTTLRRR